MNGNNIVDIGSVTQYTLPDNYGVSGRFLKTNADGTTEWAAAGGGAFLPLAGGTMSGDINLNGENITTVKQLNLVYSSGGATAFGSLFAVGNADFIGDVYFNRTYNALGGTVSSGYEMPTVNPALNEVITCINAGTGELGWTTPASGASKWTAAGADIYRLSKVGIGATVPTNSLEVRVTSQFDGMRLSKGANQLAKLGMDTASGVDSSFLQMIRTGTGGARVRFSSKSGEVNYIDNGGKFGVGTSTPWEKFTVDDGNICLNTSQPTDQVSKCLIFKRKPSPDAESERRFFIGADFYNGAPDYIGLHFGYFVGTGGGTKSNSKMVIRDNGNIGVGTITPSAKLAVNGDIKSATTPTVRAMLYYSSGIVRSHNIASVSNPSTGSFVVTFSTALPNSNYVAVASTGQLNTTAAVGGKVTTQCTVVTFVCSTGAAFNPSSFDLSIIDYGL